MTEISRQEASEELARRVAAAKEAIRNATDFAKQHKLHFTLDIEEGGANFYGQGGYWEPAGDWYSSNCW